MKHRNILGAICVSVWVGGSIPVHAADGPVPKRAEFRPTLSIGGTWKVEVEKMSEAPGLPEKELVDWKPTKLTIVYQLTVDALETIDSESCYRVRIDYKTLNGKSAGTPVEYFHIYLRQSGLTLKKVERLNAQTDHVQAFRLFEPGPVDATDWAGSLPLAFPAFQEGRFDQKPPVMRRKDGSAMGTPPGHCRQTEETTRIQVAGKETDALRITLEKKGNDGFPGHTTQTWVKGEPWWTEATYDRDGRQGRSARLIKE